LITLPEHKIIISPIGELDPLLLEQIGMGILEKFGYQVKILSLLQEIDFALDHDRGQYHSTKVLEKLASLAPSDTLKLIAICKQDLFIPILTHVYGEAQLGGKACIVSTYRLQDNLPVVKTNKVYYNRIIKEVIHELGHTFNLKHCPDHNCCMHYCRSIEDVDNKSVHFCRYCKVLMEDEIKRLLKQTSPPQDSPS
jgi:archaemetzincin